MPDLRLLACPPVLRERAAALLGAGGSAPAAVGAQLADLLPPGLRPGRTWPCGDDLVGILGGGVLIALDEEIIGGCGRVGGLDAEGCQEIGFGIAPAYQGQGLGTAAVRLLVSDLCAAPGVRSLGADVLPGNEPSRRLLTRLGFDRVPSQDRGGFHRWRLV